MDIALRVRNQRTSPLPVALDPWIQWRDVLPGGSLRIACSIEPDGWIGLQITAEALFFSARSRSEVECRSRDAGGVEVTERLAAPDDEQARAFTRRAPRPLTAWARSLGPESWRAEVGAAVPLRIGDTWVSPRPDPPSDAVDVLVWAPGEASEPTLTAGPDSSRLTSPSELRLIHLTDLDGYR